MGEMRITKISVTGLFGMFDHEIPLNQESRITIIHGPNGVGKTVLMRMVHGLFNYEYEYIASIPFELLRLVFDDESATVISVEEDRLTIDFVDKTGLLTSSPFVIRNRNSRSNVLRALKAAGIGDLFPVYFAGDLNLWYHRKYHETYTTGEILRFHPEIHRALYGDAPEWYARLLKEARTLLLNTERRRVVTVDDDELWGAGLGYETAKEEDVPFLLHLAPASLDIQRRIYQGDSGQIHSNYRLLKKLVDERFLFKSIDIDDDRVQFAADNENDIELSKLSSGEEHLLILYHQLLFETVPDSLVMIDEPELSMNVVWQRNFLKDLQRIIELRKFDVLIATHSPQIIHDKWDWVVHLGEKVDD